MLPRKPKESASLPVFRSRSGLVLAAMRVLMALLFALWILIAPPHPALGGQETAALFSLYLAFALVMLVIAWRSWWHDFRLARAAFAVDTGTFLLGLYLTEAVTLDFFSSFLTFFAFLMLTSAARWSRSAMLMIAGGLAACFLLAGLLIDWSGFHIDDSKFARRFSALAFLSLMLVWFALSRQQAQVPHYSRPAPGDDQPDDDALDGALAYAMAVYHAAGGVIAWAEAGERRPMLHAAGTMVLPDLEALDLTGAELPLLYDRHNLRKLSLDAAEQFSAQRHAEFSGLIAAVAPAQGLSIPIESRTGRGQVLLTGIPAMSADDLPSARGVAREIAAAIDDEETRALTQEVALSRLRSQIATDLHDSVAQTLAGTRFRLEALRATLGSSSGDIDLICTGIAAEQEHVRAIIARLRRGQLLPGQRDLRADLTPLIGQLARQWLVEIAMEIDAEEPVLVSSALNFELQQMLREATANAVRHGAAKTLSIAICGGERSLAMAITDDGTGFAPGMGLPGSLAGRAARLGGTLTVASRPGQTRIAVTLPMEPAA